MSPSANPPLRVKYDETSVPKIAAEIYGGTIHKTTLKLFELWLHDKEENLLLAQKYIRELKLPEDYPTTRIKNLHLRALLDETRELRNPHNAPSAQSSPSKSRNPDQITFTDALHSNEPPSPAKHRPSPISTQDQPIISPMASPIVRTPSSANLQPRSPFALLSPALRTVRHRAVSERKARTINIEQLPDPWYPPDVPERPEPLKSPRSTIFYQELESMTTRTTTMTTTTGDTWPASTRATRGEDPFVDVEGVGPTFCGRENDDGVDDDGASDHGTVAPPPYSSKTNLNIMTPCEERRSHDQRVSRVPSLIPQRGGGQPRRRLPLPAFRFPDDRPTTVDMASLSPFEASWRRMNRRLLVSAFGREDVILTENEIAFVEDMAMAERELRD